MSHLGAILVAPWAILEAIKTNCASGGPLGSPLDALLRRRGVTLSRLDAVSFLGLSRRSAWILLG
eukprot:6844260-Pyramimonas_sp.AAC.1